MIHYSLTCAAGHGFDSWFQSSDAYEKLQAAGQVACAICGATDVRRAPMAPAVATGEDTGRDRARTEEPADAGPASAPPLSTPRTQIEQAMTALRRQVEENADYVGLSFASEARAMHEGSAPERAIWGEAKPDEAKKLLEDGIPVAPLPFLPKRKAN